MRPRTGNAQLRERNGLPLVGLEPDPLCEGLPIDAQLHAGQSLQVAASNCGDRRKRRYGHAQVKAPGGNERDTHGGRSDLTHIVQDHRRKSTARQLEGVQVDRADVLGDQRRAGVVLRDAKPNVLQLQSYAGTGRGPLLEKLQGVLTGESRSVSYAEIAGQLGLTEAAVQQAASRLRKRYREALRDEIAATLDDPSDAAVESEIHDLFDALGR